MASEETPDRRAVTVRRAPKYVPFLIAGALVGAAVAAVIAYGMPADEGYNANAVFGFFLTFCAAGGAVLGAVAALLLDRRSVRRSERAVVESVPDSVPDTDDDGRA
jgi:NO-binding membrane sensor protein with MHYT domain